MSIKELKRLVDDFRNDKISKREFFERLELVEFELEEKEIIRNHYKNIASKGGKKSRRTWTEEQKQEMVKKKAETLNRKKGAL